MQRTVLILSFFVLNCWALSSDNVGDWLNKTFCTGSTCSSSYRKEIFPRDDLTTTIYVDMTFGLVAISDFDEVAGHLQLVGTMNIKWSDDIVLDEYQNSASYSFTEISIPQDEVWKPSITIFNSVDTLNAVGDSSYYVRITPVNSGNTADMEWDPGVVTKTGCSVDVSKYPWDTQTCYIIFTPWGYKETEVKFNLSSTSVDLSNYQGNEMWSVDNAASTVTTETTNDVSYARFRLVLSRKPTFFLMNMVLPIILLALLNILVFLLPADSGERVGYSVTAFLTFAVYLTIIADNLPKTSNPMSTFAYFMIMMLLMSAFICFVTIMTLRAYIRNDEVPVPEYVQKFVRLARFEYCRMKITTVIRLKPTVKETKSRNGSAKSKNGSQNGFQKKKFTMDEDSDDENFDEGGNVDPSKDADDEIEWPDVGQTTDMFFLFLFLTLIFLFCVGFLGPLSA